MTYSFLTRGLRQILQGDGISGRFGETPTEANSQDITLKNVQCVCKVGNAARGSLFTRRTAITRPCASGKKLIANADISQG